MAAHAILVPLIVMRHPGLKSLLRKYKEQTFANEKNERALESEEEEELRALCSLVLA